MWLKVRMPPFLVTLRAQAEASSPNEFQPYTSDRLHCLKEISDP